MTIKPCPFCGGEMEYHENAVKLRNGSIGTQKYWMHKDDTGCILDDICNGFTIGAGDADAETGYPGEYAERWNERAYEEQT